MGEEITKVRLNICGAEYSISSDDSKTHVVEMGKKVNEFMRGMMAGNTQVSTTQAAVLAALNFADEADKANKLAESLREQMKDYFADNVRAHQEADNARRELEELRAQLQGMNDHA